MKLPNGDLEVPINIRLISAGESYIYIIQHSLNFMSLLRLVASVRYAYEPYVKSMVFKLDCVSLP